MGGACSERLPARHTTWRQVGRRRGRSTQWCLPKLSVVISGSAGMFASPAQELQAADDLRASVCLELQVGSSACQLAGATAPRLRCLLTLQRHKADVEPFLEQPFDSYVQGMKRPSTWGGEPELSVLPHCIKRPVKVWMLAATGLQVFSQYGEDLYSSESVNILFNGVGHYDALVKRQQLHSKL